jgi:outer membrane protein assembly factor BamA
MVLGGMYDFVFNNQMIQNKKDYWIIRCGFDVAGNLLNLTYKLADAEKEADGTYHFLGEPFAQFVKVEIDASYHYKLNEASNVVYRFFAGVGCPYGNTPEAMPFEEQYYGGGANDMRAWVVRTLGPGSYVLTDDSFINQTADIKLIGNIEYRFKLFWILEGATFIDVGNIWTFWKDDNRPNGEIKWPLIQDLAVGTGLGFRFDIKFVLLRADFGFKLRDPQAAAGMRWRPLTGEYNLDDDMAVVIGIGYPF